jgi:hypothetical protein
MDQTNKKRSSALGNGKRCPYTDDMFGGVGGRQALPNPIHRGGGYQNICTILNFDASAARKKNDPRLHEINEMGLQQVWIDIAEEIGVDDFLKIWRRLDSAPEAIDDGGRILIPIRSYSRFLRYQRNRYIEALSDMGKKPQEIQAILKSELCEKISVRHILRLVQPE